MNFAAFRRMLTSLTVWIVGAGAAVAVGVLALFLMGSRLTGQPARPVAAAPAGVADTTAPATPAAGSVPAADPAVAGTPSVPASPGASPTPTKAAAPPRPAPSPTTGTAVAKVFTTDGGTVNARCSGTVATLVSWNPATGYQTSDALPGPATSVRVVFSSPAQSVRVTVTCQAGAPQASVQIQRGDD